MLLKLGQREDADADFQLKNSFNEALEGVLNDQSFKDNFNLLWDDSSVSNVSSSWKNEEWFGWFTDETFPWIYHTDLGWLYSTVILKIAFGSFQKNWVGFGPMKMFSRIIVT